MRGQDWTFGIAVLMLIGAIAGAIVGQWGLAGVSFVAALSAGAAARSLSRRYVGPMPETFRWILRAPRPYPVTPRQILRQLGPRPGERILELGPGIGKYSLAVAPALEPRGALVALDLQPRMLAELCQRAGDRRVHNVVPLRGDAMRAPLASATVDAALLVSVLGETPRPVGVLGELRRLMRPGGRVVVGEYFFDPDFVSRRELEGLAAAAGFRLATSVGWNAAYVATLELAGQGAEEPC